MALGEAEATITVAEDYSADTEADSANPPGHLHPLSPRGSSGRCRHDAQVWRNEGDPHSGTASPAFAFQGAPPVPGSGSPPLPLWERQRPLSQRWSNSLFLCSSGSVRRGADDSARGVTPTHCRRDQDEGGGSGQQRGSLCSLPAIKGAHSGRTAFQPRSHSSMPAGTARGWQPGWPAISRAPCSSVVLPIPASRSSVSHDSDHVAAGLSAPSSGRSPTRGSDPPGSS
jgi:hypothetical protein